MICTYLQTSNATIYTVLSSNELYLSSNDLNIFLNDLNLSLNTIGMTTFTFLT